MPTYSYACRDCGHSFDIQQAFSDDALSTCPECVGGLRKVYGSVGVVFKGSGFYRNDSRSSSSRSAASGGKDTGAKSGDDSGTSGEGSGTKSGDGASTSGEGNGSKQSAAKTGSGSGGSGSTSVKPAPARSSTPPKAAAS